MDQVDVQEHARQESKGLLAETPTRFDRAGQVGRDEPVSLEEGVSLGAAAGRRVQSQAIGEGDDAGDDDRDRHDRRPADGVRVAQRDHGLGEAGFRLGAADPDGAGELDADGATSGIASSTVV